MKIQRNLENVRNQPRWLSAHIREGSLLKEIKAFLKILNRNLMTSDISMNLKKSRERSYIINNEKRAPTKPLSSLVYDPYAHFRDRPEDLEERERQQIKTS